MIVPFEMFGLSLFEAITIAAVCSAVAYVIFRSTYRYGESSHSDCLRDAKKIRFYIDAEIRRLEAL